MLFLGLPDGILLQSGFVQRFSDSFIIFIGEMGVGERNMSFI